MLQAYEGYYENGRFYPIGSPVNIQGRCRVVLTVLEPVEKKHDTQQARNKPLHFSALTDEEFNAEMEKGFADLSAGKVISAESVAESMRRDYGV